MLCHLFYGFGNYPVMSWNFFWWLLVLLWPPKETRLIQLWCSHPCPVLKTWVWKVGREDTLPVFHHEAIEIDYLPLFSCNFLVFVATSHVIQAVLSAAMVSVQGSILHPSWVTVHQVESWISGCNSKFLELTQVLIWLRVICRFFLCVCDLIE